MHCVRAADGSFQKPRERMDARNCVNVPENSTWCIAEMVLVSGSRTTVKSHASADVRIVRTTPGSRGVYSVRGFTCGVAPKPHAI